MKMTDKQRIAELEAALKMGLEIYVEYMKQIATCVSQDYARLNNFPLLCSSLDITLEKKA